MAVSVDNLKLAYLSNLEYIQKHGNWLQPSSSKQLDAIREVMRNNPALSVAQLGALAALPLINGNAGLDPIRALDTRVVASTTVPQWGSFLSQWWFFYGQCKEFNFTFCLFSLPLVNPKLSGITRDVLPDYHLYLPSGGIGVGGHWYAIPGGNFMQGKFVAGDKGDTFSWMGVPDVNSPIQSILFESKTPGTFHFAVKWRDANTPANNTPPPFPGWTGVYSADVTLSAPPASAAYNGNDGCCPGCVSGIGSLYWSYPMMQVSATVTGVSPATMSNSTGVGWLDNQWVQTGKLKSNTAAVARNLATLAGPAPATRWLWLNIQDVTQGRQYMIYVPIKKNKIVEQGKTYTPAFVNMYDDSPTTPDTRVVRLPVRNVQVTVNLTSNMYNYVFPLQYTVKMTIPDQWQKNGVKTLTYTLSTIQNAPLITTPLGVFAWEGCGILTNDKGESPGYCFIEANFMTPTDNIVKAYTTQAGLAGTLASAFDTNVKPPFSAMLLSILYVGGALAFFVGMLVLMISLTKKMLRKTHPRPPAPAIQ